MKGKAPLLRLAVLTALCVALVYSIVEYRSERRRAVETRFEVRARRALVRARPEMVARLHVLMSASGTDSLLLRATESTGAVAQLAAHVEDLAPEPLSGQLELTPLEDTTRFEDLRRVSVRARFQCPTECLVDFLGALVSSSRLLVVDRFRAEAQPPGEAGAETILAVESTITAWHLDRRP